MLSSLAGSAGSTLSALWYDKGSKEAGPAPPRGGKPRSEAEIAALLARTRAAFVDAAAVERDLATGGEEGLTDAQLNRCAGGECGWHL
jgi:hypothetical protein